MAQLKVKQIGDFVAAVGTIHNATVGTASGTAISTAKSEAIASAEAKDVLRASTAVVNISTAKSEAIASAEAKDVLRASTAVVNISTAKSEAISSAVSADVVVLSSAKKYADDQDVIALTAAKSYSDVQKVRIDALLLNSTEALDTFAEISTFITSLETGDVAGLSAALSTAVSNDTVHAAGISANSSAIANLDLDFTGDFDAFGSADAAYDAAVLESTRLGNLAYDRLGDAGAAETAANEFTNQVITDLNFGDIITSNAADFDPAGSAAAAQSAAIASANGYTNGRETIIKAYADTAEADAVASANSYTNTAITALDADLQGQIDNLAGVNSVEVIAVFDSATEFSTATQFALNSHVVVFVNGLQIHEAGEGIDGWRSLDGRNFTVEGLGYDLEGDDHIVVSGTVA